MKEVRQRKGKAGNWDGLSPADLKLFELFSQFSCTLINTTNCYQTPTSELLSHLINYQFDQVLITILRSRSSLSMHPMLSQFPLMPAWSSPFNSQFRRNGNDMRCQMFLLRNCTKSTFILSFTHCASLT
jgi:hypothetical protein